MFNFFGFRRFVVETTARKMCILSPECFIFFTLPSMVVRHLPELRFHDIPPHFFACAHTLFSPFSELASDDIKCKMHNGCMHRSVHAFFVRLPPSIDSFLSSANTDYQEGDEALF